MLEIYCSLHNKSKNQICQDPFQRKNSGFGGFMESQKWKTRLQRILILWAWKQAWGMYTNFEVWHALSNSVFSKKWLILWRQFFWLFYNEIYVMNLFNEIQILWKPKLAFTKSFITSEFAYIPHACFHALKSKSAEDFFHFWLSMNPPNLDYFL